MSEIANNCKQNMDKRLKSFEGELKQVRTGRASVAVLDNIRVDYYGNPTPLNQVATLSTPDARTITIAPFEKKLIADIEKAIRIADIGVQPTNDGNVVRLPFPALTEDRRKDIVKNLKKIAEDAKVGIRNIRRDANEEIREYLKEHMIGEDEAHTSEGEVQNVTDAFIAQIDERTKAKEDDILAV